MHMEERVKEIWRRGQHVESARQMMLKLIHTELKVYKNQVGFSTKIHFT